MKIAPQLFYVSMVFLSMPTLAHADDCELLSQLTDSTGRFCCKSDGIIERVCSTHTQESCDYYGSTGTISHCDLQVSSPAEMLKHLPEQLGSVTQMGALHSPTNCQINGGGPTEAYHVDSPIDYSVNLMWINKSLNPDQKYIYPAKNEKELKENFLNHVTKWAASTNGGSIYLWYDGRLTPAGAVENTKEILAREISIHPEWATIHFRDIRDFPKVKEHPEVFSDKTPVYFRADLLRILAAYHTVKSKKNSPFVYADLDVKPLSRDELFDKKTQKNLNQFGIVVARGGHLGFENSFHITTGQNRNLLAAMKEAVIDASLERANHILGGGNWDGRRSGDTQPLEQTVYDSMQSMFKYFYHLEDWGEIDNSFHDYSFGINRVREISLNPRSETIISNRIEFDSCGKIEHKNTIKIPTKIITAPASRFGGATETVDPDKITVKNFDIKLRAAFENKDHFDNTFLYLAAKNNNLKAAELIADQLSPSDLFTTLTSLTPKYAECDASNPLNAAVQEGHSEIMSIFTKKLNHQPKLLKQLNEILNQMDDYDKMTLFHSIALKGGIHGIGLSPPINKESLESIFARSIKEGRYERAKWIAENFPDSFNKDRTIKIAMSIRKKFAPEFIEWIVSIDPELMKKRDKYGFTFAESVVDAKNWQMLKWLADHYPQTLMEKGNNGATILIKAKKNAPAELKAQLNKIAESTSDL